MRARHRSQLQPRPARAANTYKHERMHASAHAHALEIASSSCSKGQWNIQNAWKLLETSVGTWRLLLLLRFLLGMDGAFGFRACLFDSSDFGIGSRKPDQHLCACIFDTRVDHMSLHSSADGNYAQVLGAIPGVLLCICICCCICCLCGCWANWLGTGSKKDKDEDTPLLEKNEASTEK